MIKKQSTLFPEKEAKLIPEIDLKEAERLNRNFFDSRKTECTFDNKVFALA